MTEKRTLVRSVVMAYPEGEMPTKKIEMITVDITWPDKEPEPPNYSRASGWSLVERADVNDTRRT